MEEVWKDVQGYEGLYQVSNLGNVKSFRESHKYGKPKEFTLKPCLINSGYYVVTLYTGKERHKFQIHRMVANAFIPNPDNLPCVNHKDENKLNNCVDNLEWCTYQYNNNYGTARARAFTSPYEPIRQKTIDNDVIAVYKSPRIAARLLGKNPDLIRSWLKSGVGDGYMWEYV